MMIWADSEFLVSATGWSISTIDRTTLCIRGWVGVKGGGEMDRHDGSKRHRTSDAQHGSRPPREQKREKQRHSPSPPG